jgi:hypothetical protein
MVTMKPAAQAIYPLITYSKVIVNVADKTGEIGGVIKDQSGTPLCAMVLANGQYMFSCGGQGQFELKVPLDSNNEITHFVFVDGLSPAKNSLNQYTPPPSVGTF